MDKNNGLNERAERIPQRTVNLFEQVRQKIILIRDCQVILDVDVAELYGVRTKEVNQAVRNNPEKFPSGYVLELDKQEFTDLRSNILTANLAVEKFDRKSITQDPCSPQSVHGERIVYACHYPEKSASYASHPCYHRDICFCAPAQA